MTVVLETRQSAIAKLVNNNAINLAKAESIYDKIARYPDLLTDFLFWLDNPEVLPETEFEGFSVANIVREHYFRPISAFLTMADAYENPGATKAFFDEGYDIIVF